MPYLVLLIIIGIPLFFLELAVGQRIRRGSIGVWHYVCPRLGGIGFSSCIVSPELGAGTGWEAEGPLWDTVEEVLGQHKGSGRGHQQIIHRWCLGAIVTIFSKLEVDSTVRNHM